MDPTTVRLAALDRALSFAAETSNLCPTCVTEVAQQFATFLLTGESRGEHLFAGDDEAEGQGDLFEDNVVKLDPSKKH